MWLPWLLLVLHPAPGATVALEQIVSFGGTPRARWIEAEGRRCGRLVPGVLDPIDEGPGILHFVAAGEERRIAGHGIEQQPLVSFRRSLAEARPVSEVHLYRLDTHSGAR